MREWACGSVVGLSGGDVSHQGLNPDNHTFFGIFLEILGYTYACTFGGIVRFLHTGGDDASQSLLYVCSNVHACVCV